MAGSSPDVLSSFPSQNHNHARCVRSAVTSAERLCGARGARLTSIRKRVLELVWSSHAPVVAYDLLEQLKPEKANATPPTVYRALEFLLAHGLIHRIESRNAFVGCAAPDQPHAGQFLICASCDAVAELDCVEIQELVRTRAEAVGFQATTQTIEIMGVCARCGADG